MRHQLTKQGLSREQLSYSISVVVHAILVLLAFWFVNAFRSDDRVFGNILAGLLVLGGYTPWRNYILFLRYARKEDYIEVENNELCLNSATLGKGTFPLTEVISFVHKRKPYEVIELKTSNGDELALRDYENMNELINDLKQTPAGLKYQVKV